jgi:hypothetical protein
VGEGVTAPEFEELLVGSELLAIVLQPLAHTSEMKAQKVMKRGVKAFVLNFASAFASNDIPFFAATGVATPLTYLIFRWLLFQPNIIIYFVVVY